MKIQTAIKMTSQFSDILNSVIGQMSDGIWENTRSMEKYWKSLDYETDASGCLVIIDKYGACSDPVAFLANKIKQIIKIEIDNGASLTWDRCCGSVPKYLDRAWGSGIHVTVGDCYHLYDLLKGRSDIGKRYVSYLPFLVEVPIGTSTISLNVMALSAGDAKKRALEIIAEKMRVVR